MFAYQSFEPILFDKINFPWNFSSLSLFPPETSILCLNTDILIFWWWLKISSLSDKMNDSSTIVLNSEVKESIEMRFLIVLHCQLYNNIIPHPFLWIYLVTSQSSRGNICLDSRWIYNGKNDSLQQNGRVRLFYSLIVKREWKMEKTSNVIISIMSFAAIPLTVKSGFCSFFQYLNTMEKFYPLQFINHKFFLKRFTFFSSFHIPFYPSRQAIAFQLPPFQATWKGAIENIKNYSKFK